MNYPEPIIERVRQLMPNIPENKNIYRFHWLIYQLNAVVRQIVNSVHRETEVTNSAYIWLPPATIAKD